MRDNLHAGPIPEGAVARLGKGSIQDVAFSPNTNVFVIATSIGVYVYQAPEFELIDFAPIVQNIAMIEFSNDGTLLAIGGKQGMVFVLDTSTWEMVAELQVVGDQPGEVNEIISLQFSTNSNYVFAIGRRGYSSEFLKVWRVKNWQTILARGGEYSPDGVAFSPDSKSIALATEGWLGLLDLGTGKYRESHTISSLRSRVRFSPSGQFLTAVSRINVNVISLNNEIDSSAFIIRGEEYVTDIAFSSSEHMLFVTRTDELQIWDLVQNEIISETQLLLRYDGVMYQTNIETQLLIEGENDIYFLDLEDPKAPQIVDKFQHEMTSSRLPMSLNVQGEDLVWKPSGGNVYVLDVASRESIALEAKLAGRLWGLEFLPDKDFLVSWSRSQALIWDTTDMSPKKLFDGFSNDFFDDLSFVKGEPHLIASKSSDNFLEFWDFQSQEVVKNYSVHSTTFSRMVLPNKENILAIGSFDDVQIWDIDSDAQSVIFEDAGFYIFNLEFSSDGKYLVVISLMEGTVWDLDQEEIVNSFGGLFGPKTDVAFLHEDTQFVVGNNRRIETFERETGKLIKTVELDYAGAELENISSQVKLVLNEGYFITAGSDGEFHWLIMWDVNTGQMIDKMKLSSDRSRLSDYIIVNDQCFLVSEVGDGFATIWNITTREQLASITQDDTSISNAYISLEHNLLATTSGNGAVASGNGTIVLWELPPLCE